MLCPFLVATRGLHPLVHANREPPPHTHRTSCVSFQKRCSPSLLTEGTSLHTMLPLALGSVAAIISETDPSPTSAQVSRELAWQQIAKQSTSSQGPWPCLPEDLPSYIRTCCFGRTDHPTHTIKPLAGVFPEHQGSSSAPRLRREKNETQHELPVFRGSNGII